MLTFSKMHGIGNDYIYINCFQETVTDPEKLSIFMSNVRFGVGSDGLVLILPSEVADFRMRIFNADGSEAMMCGNASRCIGKYVYDKRLTNKKNITLETLSGIKELQLTTRKLSGPHEEVTEVTVDMGCPVIGETALEIEAGDYFYTGTVISMGNPHLVIFVEDITNINLPVIGPLLECHPLFPNRTNVEFVQALSTDEVRMKVWERGSGITQACGTGACATAVASAVRGKTGRKTKVVMDGGPLTTHWDESSGHVYMTGGAVKVFEGELEI